MKNRKQAIMQAFQAAKRDEWMLQRLVLGVLSAKKSLKTVAINSTAGKSVVGA